MTIRLVCALAAIVCGVLIAFVAVDNPDLLIGGGIVLAALAAVIDR